MNKIPLGERMKKYEESTNFRIIPRTPMVVRADGKKFSSLTKKLNLDKPYDRKFSTWMTEAMKKVCEEIQGCVLGYTQSDEITFIIRTDQSNDTTPWFDNRIQKIVSTVASIVSVAFNRQMWNDVGEDMNFSELPCGYFDCRVWPMPSMTEVVNNLIWRQRDCTKNSISSSAYYEVGKVIGFKITRKMLQNLKQEGRQELLFSKTGINWNEYPAEFKRGIVAYKIKINNGNAIRKVWIDSPAPIFTGEEGRSWLNLILNPSREENVKEEKEVG